MIKIMLDPGHAGAYYNASPVVKGYYESVMTWSLALKLKASLERRGFFVGMTRNDVNDDPPLVERGRKSAGFDLFLSLHSNASSREDATAPWMIVFSDDVNIESDEVSRKVGEVLGETVSRTMKLDAPFIYTKMTDFDRDGNGILDDEYYGVLFGAKSVGTPGVILEHGFHTNRNTAQWLMSEDNLSSLAEAEAETLLKYFGLGGENVNEENLRELSQLKKRIEALEAEAVSYDTIDSCPSWAKETVFKLTEKGYLKGDGSKLSLTKDMLRILVVLDRSGAF